MPEKENLILAISGSLKKADTQSLDISFNELLDMVVHKELNITPDYQRLFRWTEGQRSRFIESLILELPVPPIFVIEDDDGKYELIDGLQRISSYLHLRGELSAPHLQRPVKVGNRLKFVDCDIIPQLNGFTFDDLPSSIQVRLKRAFIRVEVIRRGTDPHFKYHMFKRLNTGGEGLSDQQVRNCAVRLLSKEFPDFIVTCSDLADFRVCTEALTEARVLSGIDQELVLRFFAMKNRRDMFKHEVSDFLTDYMEGVAEPDPAKKLAFDYDAEMAIFAKTFELLRAALADKSFAFRNKAGNALAAGFSAYHYEAITLGIQAVLPDLDVKNRTQIKKLREVLSETKLDDDFVKMTTGGGKNSPGPLKARIEYVETRLKNAFAN